MNYHTIFRVFSVLLFTSTVLLSSAEAGPCEQKRGTRYKVRIDSAPQGAAVYLGDKGCGILGYTPWEGRLVRGEHTLLLEAKGFKDTTKTITVRRTRSTQETFVPMAQVEEGTLEIRGDAGTDVVGAEVWVDGQLKGNVPMTLTLVKGRHLLEIKKEGFDTTTQWIETKPGERMSMTPGLKSSSRGSLLIDSDTPEAEVWIDGLRRNDTTPTMVNGLSAGPHVIEVRKPPAAPWKDTVVVEANKTKKIKAQLSQSGGVRVLTNVEGTQVFLDGTVLGAAPLDIKDIAPGEHIVEVKAPGYTTQSKKILAVAGKSEVLQFTMLLTSEGNATIKVVSQVPGAQVYIDGESVGTAPQEKSVSAGEHFVVVSKPGYGKIEHKINAKGGEVYPITAELREVGALRVLSSPAQAEVFLDGEPLGKTTFDKDDVAVGEHIIVVRYPGHRDYEDRITIAGGQRIIVNAKLSSEMTSEQILTERQKISTLSARVLPYGRAAVDLSVGFPHYLDARITVGAGKINKFEFDAGALLRSYGPRTEFGIHGRVSLAKREPFSLAGFTQIGGGGNFFDDSSRNSFFWNLGVVGSLTALGRVTVSARTHINVFSDRHCPEVDSSGTFSSSPIDACQGYYDIEQGAATSPLLSAEDKQEIDSILDGDSPFSRDAGVRWFVGLAVEIAVVPKTMNVWLLFDGVPFQSERLAYKNVFYGTMFNNDPKTYLRGGVTIKF